MPVLHPSIRRDLLKWLIAPLLIVNLLGAGLTYWLAWLPAEHAFDRSLTDSAWALYAQLRHRQDKTTLELNQQAEQILRADESDSTYYVVRDADGTSIAGDNDFPAIATSDIFERPYTYDAEMKGASVRVAAIQSQTPRGVVMLAVAETFRKRDRTQVAIGLSLLLLDAVLTALTIGVVLMAVRRGLHPLRTLQASLEQRDHSHLSALDNPDTPTELQPLVSAMNGLLERIRKANTAQQNFLADVAHQLRTPLTGLKLQLELLHARMAKEQDAAGSISMMNASVDRMIRQSRQLLALARAEPGVFEQRHLESLSLDKLVEESIQHFIEEADKKQIDLGFDLQPGRLRGDRFLLRDLIDNLIDNAVRYSPHAGEVTVSCFEQGGETVLTVEDSGPGIAPEHRELIFDRFYRANDKIAGSGLGLAIVREIAHDHGASIGVTCGEEGHGTVFTVRFPLPG